METDLFNRFLGAAGSPGPVWAPERGPVGVDLSSGGEMDQRYWLEGEDRERRNTTWKQSEVSPLSKNIYYPS